MGRCLGRDRMYQMSINLAALTFAIHSRSTCIVNSLLDCRKRDGGNVWMYVQPGHHHIAEALSHICDSSE